MSINPTLIDWVKNPDGTPGFTWNPITGCLNQVDGMCKGGNFPCYAYRLGNGRLKQIYLANQNWNLNSDALVAMSDPFYPRFWPERLEELPVLKTYQGRFSSVVKNALYEKQRKGIFVCDMSDLFGIGIPEDWTRQVLHICKMASQHRFYLLTKQPQNLIKFSPFPDNCWVGVTATNQQAYLGAIVGLTVIEAKVKYISFEPLLEYIAIKEPYELNRPEEVHWLIIGAMTCGSADLAKVSFQHPELTPMPYGNRYTLQPKIEWVEEIVRAADKAGIPVFLKDNLKPLLTSTFHGVDVIDSHNLWAFREFRLRQEFPK